jgi:hypothetical protein
VHPRREHHRSARQYQACPRRPGRPCPAGRRPEEECHQVAPARRSLSDRNPRTPPLQSMEWNHQPGCRPVLVVARLTKGSLPAAHPKRCCHPAAGRLTKGSLPAVHPMRSCHPAADRLTKGSLPAVHPKRRCHPAAGRLTKGSLPAAHPKRRCHPAAGRPMWRASHRLAGPTTDHQADWKTVPRSADPRTGSRPVRHPREHRSLAGAAHFRNSRRKNPATGCRCSAARPAARKNSPWGFHRSVARRTGSGFRMEFRSCHRRTNQSVPAEGTASLGRIPGCLAPPAAKARMSPGCLRRSWVTKAKTRVRKARTTATKVRTTVRTRATPEAAASRWTDPPSCSRPARPARPGIQATRILSSSS